MPRLTMPDPADMTPEQHQAVAETVGGKRGKVPAPLHAWIRSPELARRGQALGEFLRYDTIMPARMVELAILVTARHWTAHYEWMAHKKLALEGGLAPAIIDAIAARTTPAFTAPDEQMVYTVAQSLLQTQSVPDALYAEAIIVLGERALVELVGVLGYYALVSMTLNTFQIGMPEGFQQELG
jgi:4-carboxymuconolactone decarboxylase